MAQMITATINTVVAIVIRDQLSFPDNFIFGCSQINGKARGGIQNSVIMIEDVLQYQGIVLSSAARVD